jgi:predicted O-methyltransferase YrrM
MELVELTKTVDERPKVLKDLIRRPNSFRYYKLFVHLAQQTHPKLIVELGTNQGVGALHFRHGTKDARIITVDIVTTKKTQDRLFAHNIEGVICDAAEYAEQVENGTVDIIFFDANHEYTNVMSEVKAWMPKMCEGGIALFDDIHYGVEKRTTGYISEHNKRLAVGEETGMLKAWTEICETYGKGYLEVKYLHPSVNFGVLFL